MAFIIFTFYFTLDGVLLLLLIFPFFLFIPRVCRVATTVGITVIFGDIKVYFAIFWYYQFLTFAWSHCYLETLGTVT